MRNYNEHKVFGIGFTGIGKYSKTNSYKIYNIWARILQKCYSDKCQIKTPTYIDCSVVEEWYNFQVFAEWYENNYIENFHLDKDILVKGNKIYGPDTCCFVPQEINQLFTKTNKLRGELPIGVSLHGKNYRVQVKLYGKSKNFGTYKTIEKAFEIYKIEKEKYIKEVTEIWKNKLPEKTYKILINYKVEITD